MVFAKRVKREKCGGGTRPPRNGAIIILKFSAAPRVPASGVNAASHYPDKPPVRRVVATASFVHHPPYSLSNRRHQPTLDITGYREEQTHGQHELCRCYIRHNECSAAIRMPAPRRYTCYYGFAAFCSEHDV